VTFYGPSLPELTQRVVLILFDNACPIVEKDLLLKSLPFQRKVIDDKIRLDKTRFNTKSCLFLLEKFLGETDEVHETNM